MNISVLSSVEKIIDDIFFDDTIYAISLLKQYKLYTLIDERLNYLSSQIEQDNQLDFITLSISFIQEVNTILDNVEDEEEKKKLKYFLGSISNYIIDTLTNEKIITSQNLISLKDSLKNLAEVKNYNFQDIEMRLQIDRLIKRLDSSEERNSTKVNPYYEWKSKAYKLDEISKDLKSENVILSTKKFKKLFTLNPVSFKVSPDKADFLFVLFEVLYDFKLITPKIKKGKFSALVEFAIDLNEKVLYEKIPKYIKQEIKKNPQRYNELRERAIKWISDERLSA